MKKYQRHHPRFGRSACLILPVFILSLAALPAKAGQFFKESFESAPGGSYTLTDPFDDGFFDFFNRYAVPDAVHGDRSEFVSGWDGSYGIMGEDHDGDGGAATRVVTISGINISGRSGLSVKIALGANDGSFFEAADGDGIKIYATIDGGARKLIGEFAPSGPASKLFKDTDGDGVGDGAQLTESLAAHTFKIAGGGSTLKIEIEMTSTGDLEHLAVDNVRVSSTGDTWTPNYELATYFYNLYVAYGYPNYAAAFYYYYYALGDYYYHIALGNTATALFEYYEGFGLYYFYLSAASGNYNSAYYNYYVYLALAYYYYYAEFGNFDTAVLYYNAFVAYALFFG